MFTGISECQGKVVTVETQAGGFDFWVESGISKELKIDQSLSHDGICLTVVEIKGDTHKVQAIAETVAKTQIKHWVAGTPVNLERCMPASGRFDGHIVQGHVDTTGIVEKILDSEGQLMLWINHNADAGDTVKKGSVCINGISLTVVDSNSDRFSVALIPYTREHTNLGRMKMGDLVNIEFDIIGKYLKKFNQNGS